MACPVGVEELTPLLIDALISVGAEIVALRLEQIRGQPRGAVAVVEGQRGGKRRSGNAQFDGVNQRLAPRCLIAVERLGEEAVQQQIFNPRILVESLFDLSQEAAANDASAAPHQRDSSDR